MASGRGFTDRLPVLTGYSPPGGRVGGESEPTGGFGEPQEAHMFVNRRIAKFAALALAAGATAAAVEIGVQPVSAQTGSGRLCTTTNGRGYPDAVPPILAPPPCSALPAIRRQE